MKLLTVFADASYKDGAGGYAYWCRGDGPERVQGSAPWPCDSIAEAETVGLAVAFMEAIDALPLEVGGSVVLQSDSLCALGAFITLGVGRQAKTSDRPVRSVKVSEIQRAFVERVARIMREKNLHIWIKHVKAHTGHEAARSKVNEWCDREAKKARRLCEQRNAAAKREVQ